jgi:hypothetical protein
MERAFGPQIQRQDKCKNKYKCRSRFPEGMTERKASATARATARATTKANTGILHYVQDDGGSEAMVWPRDDGD